MGYEGLPQAGVAGEDGYLAERNKTFVEPTDDLWDDFRVALGIELRPSTLRDLRDVNPQTLESGSSLANFFSLAPGREACVVELARLWPKDECATGIVVGVAVLMFLTFDQTAVRVMVW